MSNSLPHRSIITVRNDRKFGTKFLLQKRKGLCTRETTNKIDYPSQNRVLQIANQDANDKNNSDKNILTSMCPNQVNPNKSLEIHNSDISNIGISIINFAPPPLRKPKKRKRRARRHFEECYEPEIIPTTAKDMLTLPSSNEGSLHCATGSTTISLFQNKNYMGACNRLPSPSPPPITNGDLNFIFPSLNSNTENQFPSPTFSVNIPLITLSSDTASSGETQSSDSRISCSLLSNILGNNIPENINNNNQEHLSITTTSDIISQKTSKIHGTKSTNLLHQTSNSEISSDQVSAGIKFSRKGKLCEESSNSRSHCFQTHSSSSADVSREESNKPPKKSLTLLPDFVSNQFSTGKSKKCRGETDRSKDFLKEKSIKCLQSLLQVLYGTFGVAPEHCMAILKSNSFNVLTTLQELQYEVPSSDESIFTSGSTL